MKCRIITSNNKCSLLKSSNIHLSLLNELPFEDCVIHSKLNQFKYLENAETNFNGFNLETNEESERVDLQL